jgi:uncharacterized protein (TIGR04255 family)
MNITAKKPIPQKLKHDFIIEALFELRFDSSSVAEILVGRLADYEPWRAFQQRRLPVAELPVAIRNEPDLRFTPWFELADPAGNRSVRIGEHVLSYHQLAPYVGWTSFRPELHRAIEGLFERVPALKVKRLGLRYINGVRPELHGVLGITDLDVAVSVEGQSAPTKVNLNFISEVTAATGCAVRIANQSFVKGKLPETTAMIIDVDVFTDDADHLRDVDQVKAWVEFAHDTEKQQFFRLLKRSTIDALMEK